jgi:hypothetical protein
MLVVFDHLELIATSHEKSGIPNLYRRIDRQSGSTGARPQSRRSREDLFERVSAGAKRDQLQAAIDRGSCPHHHPPQDHGRELECSVDEPRYLHPDRHADAELAGQHC